MIFHDSTLAQMIEVHPISRDEFALLGGVGEHKLAKYADAFLAVLRDHPRRPVVSLGEPE